MGGLTTLLGYCGIRFVMDTERANFLAAFVYIAVPLPTLIVAACVPVTFKFY